MLIIILPNSRASVIIKFITPIVNWIFTCNGLLYDTQYRLDEEARLDQIAKATCSALL